MNVEYKKFLVLLEEDDPNLKKSTIYHSKRCTIYLYEHEETNIHIVVKAKNKKDTLFFSYLIGRFLLNKLNFDCISSTYDYITTVNSDILLQEYIKGTTLKKFLRDRKINGGRPEFLVFKRLFVAILMDLISIQKKAYFCHFDLHLNNIIIEESSSHTERTHSACIAFKYKLELKTHRYHPVFIDFEYATARRKNQTVLYNKNVLIDYGYMGCFLAGSDILRLLFCLKREVFTASTFFYGQIEEFIDSILSSCFHLKINDKDSFFEHSKFYFNMAFTSQIFITPESVLQFVYQLEEEDVTTEASQNEIKLVETKQYNKIDNKKEEIQTHQFINLLDTITYPLLTSSFEVLELFIRRNKGIKKYMDILEKTNNPLPTQLSKNEDLYIDALKASYMIETFSQYTNNFKKNPIQYQTHPICSQLVNNYLIQNKS